ncbi:MAG: hypothetical protein ACKVQA_09370 [Burkholderiales bacterium]
MLPRRHTQTGPRHQRAIPRPSRRSERSGEVSLA